MTSPLRPRDEHVAVVVVTYNSASLLPDLLASLPAGLGDVPWHLVVADNASTDGTVDVARRLAPDATIVEVGRNAGYAAGINAGVAAAGTFTAVLVLNADVRLDPGCVPELLRALREPGTGIAVPRLVDGDGVLIESIRREPTTLRTLADAVMGARRAGRFGALGETVSDPRRYETEAVIDWAEGSTQLISAECWEKCGPWDESFFLYSEETEYDLRAGDNGCHVRFVPTAGAIHLEGGSGETPGLWRLMILNRVRLHGRRHGRLSTACFWLATLLREGSRALLGRPTSRAALTALVSPRRWAQTPGPEAVKP